MSLLFKRIINRLGHPFGVNPFPRGFDYVASSTQREDAFEAIYQQNLWGSEQSHSGHGSELDYTSRYRNALSQLIQKRGITSLFDAPCGDLNWMQHVIAQTGIAYSGGDISASVIAATKAKHPSLDLRQFDICRDAFPKADLFHCRDCLFHLPFADIQLALANFAASDIPFALITTHKARLLHKNLDIKVGGFRLLDVQRAPINLPPALEYLPDYRMGRDFPRYMGLWSREMITQALNHATPRISTKAA